MNLARLFLLPWWAAPKMTRGLIGALIALLTLALSVAVVVKHHSPDYFWSMWCMINLVAWALLMPNAMVIARDARMLRLPALERDAVLSLIVYALALVVVPGMLIAARGNLAVVQTILSFALCAAIPMACMCLPGYIAAFIYFGWLFLKQLGPSLPAAIGLMNYTTWAVPTLFLLLLAIAWGWRRTVRGAIAATSYSAPMVLKLRMSAWKGSDKTDIALVRQRPDWLRAQPDLRRCGPEYPQQSIRMALGGMFLPQRWTSRLRTWFLVVIWSALFVAYMAIQAWPRHPDANWTVAWRVILYTTLGWGVGFGATMVAFTSLLRLNRVWQNVTGELPLLALLPGLSTRSVLMRAILAPPLRMLLVLLALSLVCALALHLPTIALSFVVLAQFGCIAFVIAFALLIAGGKLPNKWLAGALGCAGFLLVTTCLGVPTMSDPTMLKFATGNLFKGLVAAWILFGAALFWLGLRGWRGLRERPHLFLPNGA